MPAKAHFRIDREELQNLFGKEVDPYSDPNCLLEVVRGKEATVWVKTERFEQVKVKAIFLGPTAEMAGTAELWVEDWKGRLWPKPWAIKVSEVSRD